MATLNLHDANHSYASFPLKVANIEYPQLQELPASGTISINGATFTCNKTVSPGYIRWEFDGKLWFTSGNVSAVINALGLTSFRNYTIADLFKWYPGMWPAAEPDPDVELTGADHGPLTYPKFEVDFTPDGSAGGGDYFGTVSMSRASGYTENVGPVAMDDNGETRHGLVGYMAVNTGDPEDAFGGMLFGIYCFNCWKRYNGDDPRMLVTFVISSQITANEFPDEYSVDAGDKGFRPITIKPTQPTQGGGSTSGGSPTYPTDVLTQPGAPDESVASAAASGLLNAYKIDAANLAHLCYNLFSPTWQSKFTHLFWEPLDSIISLQVFPCSPNVGTQEYVKTLGYMNKMDPDGLRDAWEASQAYPLTNQFKVFDCGSLSIPEMFESFLDYDASSFELFLPFIGDISMPVNEVMGSTINVQYTVDFFTGMCVANVLITKNTPLSNGNVADQYAQHSYMGNCAVQMPLSSTQYGNIMGSLAQAASMGLKTGLAGAAGSLASSAANGGFRPTVATKGTIGANAGFCGILQPYITITRPIPIEPENYQTVVGYPSYIDAVLGTCEGFCRCKAIDLHNVAGMTQSEADRVTAMCKEGIII